jgi:hypothetical protein
MAYTIKTEGTELVIRIDLNAKAEVSKSGKSHVIGSSNGFVGQSTEFGTVKIGFNVITTDANWAGGATAKPAPTPSLVKRA